MIQKNIRENGLGLENELLGGFPVKFENKMRYVNFGGYHIFILQNYDYHLLKCI